MRSSSADIVIVDELLWYARLKNGRVHRLVTQAGKQRRNEGTQWTTGGEKRKGLSMRRWQTKGRLGRLVGCGVEEEG